MRKRKYHEVIPDEENPTDLTTTVFEVSPGESLFVFRMEMTDVLNDVMTDDLAYEIASAFSYGHFGGASRNPRGVKMEDYGFNRNRVWAIYSHSSLTGHNHSYDALALLEE